MTAIFTIDSKTRSWASLQGKWYFWHFNRGWRFWPKTAGYWAVSPEKWEGKWLRTKTQLIANSSGNKVETMTWNYDLASNFHRDMILRNSLLVKGGCIKSSKVVKLCVQFSLASPFSSSIFPLLDTMLASNTDAHLLLNVLYNTTF